MKPKRKLHATFRANCSCWSGFSGTFHVFANPSAQTADLAEIHSSHVFLPLGRPSFHTTGPAKTRVGHRWRRSPAPSAIRPGARPGRGEQPAGRSLPSSWALGWRKRSKTHWNCSWTDLLVPEVDSKNAGSQALRRQPKKARSTSVTN